MSRKKSTKKKSVKILEEAEAVQGKPELSTDVKILQKENGNLRRKLATLRSGEGMIIEAVKDAWESPADMEFPKIPYVKNMGRGLQEIACLHISDTQIGKITATYDTDVADRRLQLLARKAINLTRVRRNGSKIDEIRIYLGGDMIEGEDIFPHQAHLIDSSVFEQAVKNAPAMLARCILTLAGDFRKVKVVCVAGNHGRNGPKGTRAHPKTNWDTVAYEVMKLMLVGTPENPTPISKRLQVEIAPSFYYVDRVFDWGNLMVHGHQITGGFAGFPWYGTAKKAWGWIDSIPDPWDYLWFGHFHTYASAVLNHRTFLCNGTTESDNVFAQAQLAAAGFPCQRLSYFDAEHGLIADNQIFLTDEGTRIPQRIRATNWL